MSLAAISTKLLAGAGVSITGHDCEQEYVLIAFFGQEIRRLTTFPLVGHIDYDQFISLIFEPKKLWDHLVSGDVRCWIIDCLLNPPEIVLLWVSKIQ